MIVKIDTELCVGCGLCEENIPEIFRTGDYTAELKTDNADEKFRKRLEETIEDCPTKAISLA